MLLDTQNLFSDNQPIADATTYSSNIVKFGSGDVSYLPVIIQVVDSFVNTDTLTVKIQTSSDESFTSAVDLAQSSLTKDELVAGAKFPLFYLPRGNKGYMRLVYLASYTAEATAETAGKITAGVVAGHELSYHEQ